MIARPALHSPTTSSTWLIPPPWAARAKVYAYDASGQRDSASDFDLDADNIDPDGITFANGGFYVVDKLHDNVYAYGPERDSATVFDLDSANEVARGITFANGKFYVVDVRADKVYAYQSSGQRDSASDFDLDPDNGYPRGITFANDRFYVADGVDGKVYAHHASGQRDFASDFDLGPDNGSPSAITFANDRFYVVDETNDKVYAYDASGQRDSASDFDLDSDNGDATGITFASNRIYVVDGGDDFVYAYDASGQRDSAYDHYLHPANELASGITFANGRLYVVDRDGGAYVLNSTAPSPDLEIPTASVRPVHTADWAILRVSGHCPQPGNRYVHRHDLTLLSFVRLHDFGERYASWHGRGGRAFPTGNQRREDDNADSSSGCRHLLLRRLRRIGIRRTLYRQQLLQCGSRHRRSKKARLGGRVPFGKRRHPGERGALRVHHLCPQPGNNRVHCYHVALLPLGRQEYFDRRYGSRHVRSERGGR